MSYAAACAAPRCSVWLAPPVVGDRRLPKSKRHRPCAAFIGRLALRRRLSYAACHAACMCRMLCARARGQMPFVFTHDVLHTAARQHANLMRSKRRTIVVGGGELKRRQCVLTLGSLPCHICAGTGLPCHICTGTGLTPCHICTGLGSPPATSATRSAPSMRFGWLGLQPQRGGWLQAPRPADGVQPVDGAAVRARERIRAAGRPKTTNPGRPTGLGRVDLCWPLGSLKC